MADISVANYHSQKTEVVWNALLASFAFLWKFLIDGGTPIVEAFADLLTPPVRLGLRFAKWFFGTALLASFAFLWKFLIDGGTPIVEAFADFLAPPVKLSIRTWLTMYAVYLVVANIDEAENNKAKRIAEHGVKKVTYFSLDYTLGAGSAALVVGMNAMSFDFWEISVLSSIYDLVIAFSFWIASLINPDRYDLTYGADVRRGIDKLGRVTGSAVWFASTFVFLGGVIVWFGPENVATFFRKELSKLSAAFVLALLCMGQGVIHTFFYSYLYGLALQVVGGV